MAEIKSTLDIIMEKAKKFSVTEEEKKGFRRQELEGKIKGLVQKTIDGILDSDRFQVEVVALREKELVNQILRDEVMARLDVGANSKALLMMLEHMAGPAFPAVRTAVSEFEKSVEKRKDLRRKALLADFKKKGISGPAVLPNLDADPEWARIKAEMKKQLQEMIREQIKSPPISL